ncbi:MAG: hypothetical protein J1F35_06385 [Erysipelotrichales bacterium]|nr:hypothetical protein [Erysipelotrichales bacterium]
MNLTATFWTKPMIDGRWEVKDQIKHTLLLCALSSIYAKRSGAHITIHCDSKVYNHLKKMKYDEVYCDLDDLKIEKSDSTLMWAAGKFITLKNEPLKTIHIDNDVFIKKPECLEQMKFDGYDFICQHIEKSEYKEQSLLKDHIQTVDMNSKFACCVGILGFNNQELLDKYIEHYEYYRKNLNYDIKGNKFLNADLILEQSYMYDRMIEGYKCKTLIGDIRTDHITKIQYNSSNIGYEHLIGNSKYMPYIIKRLKKELKKLDLELFNYIETL